MWWRTRSTKKAVPVSAKLYARTEFTGAAKRAGLLLVQRRSRYRRIWYGELVKPGYLKEVRLTHKES